MKQAGVEQGQQMTEDNQSSVKFKEYTQTDVSVYAFVINKLTTMGKDIFLGTNEKDQGATKCTFRDKKEGSLDIGRGFLCDEKDDKIKWLAEPIAKFHDPALKKYSYTTNHDSKLEMYYFVVAINHFEEYFEGVDYFHELSKILLSENIEFVEGVEEFKSHFKIKSYDITFAKDDEILDKINVRLFFDDVEKFHSVRFTRVFVGSSGKECSDYIDKLREELLISPIEDGNFCFAASMEKIVFKENKYFYCLKIIRNAYCVYTLVRNRIYYPEMYTVLAEELIRLGEDELYPLNFDPGNVYYFKYTCGNMRSYHFKRENIHSNDTEECYKEILKMTYLPLKSHYNIDCEPITVFNLGVFFLLFLTGESSIEKLIERHGGDQTGILTEDIIESILNEVKKQYEAHVPILKLMLEIDEDQRIGLEALLEKIQHH